MKKHILLLLLCLGMVGYTKYMLSDVGKHNKVIRIPDFLQLEGAECGGDSCVIGYDEGSGSVVIIKEDGSTIAFVPGEEE